MEKQTLEQAIEKTVKWWSEKSFRTSLNQNNGDDSDNGGMAFMLMNMVAMKAQDTITEPQIDIFEKELTRLMLEGGRNNLQLDVDYHPCEYLFNAAKKAKINSSCFPCKSYSRITAENEAYASYQYHGEREYL